MLIRDMNKESIIEDLGVMKVQIHKLRRISCTDWSIKKDLRKVKRAGIGDGDIEDEESEDDKEEGDGLEERISRQHILAKK